MIGEAFVSLILVWLVWHVIFTYMSRRNMPPGPFPFPLVGNIPHMLCDPVQPFDVLAKKYGDIFTLTLPMGCAVILNSAIFARDERVTRLDDFLGKVRESIYPWPEMLGNDIITADYTPAYRFRRRVFKTALHVFGAGIEEASGLAGQAVDITIKEIESKQGESFSPKELFESSIIVQLWEWLTSKNVALDDPTIKCISEFGKIIANQSFLSSLYQNVPFLSYLPTQFNRDINRAIHIRKTIFSQEYQSHKETYTPGVIRDLTDSFISSYEKEIAKETIKDIGSSDDIVGLMTDVAFAGSDTTSSSLAWLFLYLVLNQDVQERMHKELDDVIGSDRIPQMKDFENMPYLQATLCEVQRASGLIPVIGRNTIRDITIDGYIIPKGTLVGFNAAKIHRDERNWLEPEKFKPERFLDCDGNFVGWNKLKGFLPFGIGRRECPGQSLAKIMMFTFASILLHRYKIELPEGAEIPSTEISVAAAISRPKDFKVVALKRN